MVIGLISLFIVHQVNQYFLPFFFIEVLGLMRLDFFGYNPLVVPEVVYPNCKFSCVLHIQGDMLIACSKKFSKSISR